MIKQIIKVVVWIPVIFMAMIIFGFSAQDGKKSGGLSNKVAGVIIDIADMVNIIDVNEDNREQYISRISFPVRKAAHMTEYAVLTAFVYIALLVDGVRFNIRMCASGIGVFAFAASDEIHQLFIPGRCGLFTDVLVDMTGAVAALLICILVNKQRKRI